ncbi:hypothetical protein BU15DRAFT_84200, partial [Melanogaster broomeanus]
YAIVGGVIGGLVVLVATILVIFCFRRRGRGNKALIDLDAAPTVDPFVLTDVQQCDAEPPSSSKRPTLRATGSSVPAGIPTHQSGIGHSDTNDITDDGLSAPPPTDPSSTAFSPEALKPSRPQVSRAQQTQLILMDDQADFVNSLQSNNVLVAAIARVMESMMAGERRSAMEGYAAALESPHTTLGMTRSWLHRLAMTTLLAGSKT